VSGAACDRSWELDAYREGRLGEPDAASFERHLRSCGTCAELRQGDEKLRGLARRIGLGERDVPDALRLRRLRRRILNDAALDRGGEPRGRGATWLAGAVAVAILAGVAWSKRHVPATAVAAATPVTSQRAVPPRVDAPPPPDTADPPAPAWAGTVSPTDGARWSRSRESEVERVRLEAGSLSIHVRHQQPGERFLVVLPDGDLEVRGTTFDVAVKDDRTRAVHVTEGVVELRIAGLPVRRLEAGGSWSFQAPLAANPASPATSARKTPYGDDGAADYANALRALGAGDNEGASSALRAFVISHPGAPQTEDATFLEAVALARAGRIDAAGNAAEEHLARFPESFHRRDALVLIERAARARDAGR
jgi:hypothetical protein